MRRIAFCGILMLAACAHAGVSAHRNTATTRLDLSVDSLYWQGVRELDPSNKNGSVDAGIASLDAYLASPGDLPHKTEAAALRSLARNSQQLARVQAALQQARATPDGKPADSKSGANEEAVKEIQRLKDELAKANEELERIKKRLAAPKP